MQYATSCTPMSWNIWAMLTRYMRPACSSKERTPQVSPASSVARLDASRTARLAYF